MILQGCSRVKCIQRMPLLIQKEYNYMFKIMVNWDRNCSYPITEYNGWEEVDEFETEEEAHDMVMEYAMAYKADQGNCVIEVAR